MDAGRKSAKQVEKTKTSRSWAGEGRWAIGETAEDATLTRSCVAVVFVVED